ncbi:LuxR family transcriptional regulator [Oryzifoliimicrobium ureilyticus]|uniref:LuxR family transcriptional regulator n=1 Tax=Oryzifoliimicrobium ureilyticus TaxID=3113724 RepID=UPI003075F16B
MDVTAIEELVSKGESFEEKVDGLFKLVQGFGFDALIYDYTPIRYDLDGQIMIPSVLELRNVDESMRDYWSGQGYIRIDPVQRVALRTTAPFFWSYDPQAETLIRTFMTEDCAPVAAFLAERELTAGVTVPIHLPQGDYATVTGIMRGNRRKLAKDASHYLADFGLAAHLFQREAEAALTPEQRYAGLVRLTARERECLAHSAEGLSAKEISRVIGRSVPTVVMHLNAATRKLGAKNRAHAAVRAAHLRLFDQPSH